MNNELLQKIKIFFRKYGLFLAPVVLFLFFMFILVLSYIQGQKQPAKTTLFPVPTKTSANVNNPTAQPSREPGDELAEDERNMVVWTPLPISDSDFGDIKTTKTTRADGSLQFTYASDMPNRPTIIITKNGVNIFQRIVMHNTQIDPDDEVKPDYVATGSKFWGNNVVTRIFLSKGYAYVVDLTTNLVLEEMTFQPTTIAVFKSYDDDLLGDVKKP